MKLQFVILLWSICLAFFAQALSAQQFRSPKISEYCMPSSCYLETPSSTGSGFVVSDEGHVITNYHVIEETEGYAGGFDAEEIKVGFKNGYQTRALEVVATDEELDLALLRISSTRDPLPVLSEGTATMGTKVAVIGKPKGLTMSVNAGNVTSLLEDIADDAPFFQFDASVNPGNSGGPVVNKNGQVVGVVVARLEAGRFGREVQNMNVAIQVSYLRAFLDEHEVPYTTEPLIKDIFLRSVDSLSAEQKEQLEAMKQARIDRIKKREQEEQRRKDQLMRERMRAEREMQEISERRKKQLAEEKFQHERRLQDAEYQRKIEAEKDRKERIRLRREQDENELKRKKQRLRERKKRYYKKLPPRILLSAGGGAQFFGGRVNGSPVWSRDALSWYAETNVAYRLDLRKRSKGKGHRGTALGVAFQTGQLGEQPGMTEAPLNFSESQPEGQAPWMYALEGRLLVREWFLLGGGYEWATRSGESTKYPIVRTGVVGRLGPFDALLRGTVGFADDNQNFWRMEAGLALRFGFGKW